MAVKKEETAPAAPEKIPVMIPKTGKGDDERLIAVNGRRILVQTGKTVYLPPEFAEVVLNSQAMETEAQAYIDANLRE